MNPGLPSTEDRPVLPAEPLPAKPATHVAGPTIKPRPPAPPYVVLTGNPNSGKTTLFNALTGLRAKVGNYAGVTVERKEGRLLNAPAGLNARVLYAYSCLGLIRKEKDSASGIRVQVPSTE